MNHLTKRDKMRWKAQIKHDLLQRRVLPSIVFMAMHLCEGDLFKKVGSRKYAYRIIRDFRNAIRRVR